MAKATGIPQIQSPNRSRVIPGSPIARKEYNKAKAAIARARRGKGIWRTISNEQTPNKG